MKSFTVIIAPEAQEQITNQVEYIAEDSVDNAIAWETRLRQAILSLGEMTGYAVDAAASERVGFPVRKMVFEKTVLVHYQVDKAARQVRVLNFRHGARLPRRGEP